MDPFVSLTVAAMATKRLRVGTGVCLVVQRDPIQTAKLVASLDSGVRRSGFCSASATAGTPRKSPITAPRLRPGTSWRASGSEAMRTIWTQPKPEYHGEFVDFAPMLTWPKPLQNRIPR